MTDTNHTDSVEAVGSLLYEVKHRIEWDYSYYVSREKSTGGYWKRVSSIEEIPTHAVSTHKTHPVDEPDNLFLFKIYQYLLNHQQQVEEAVLQADATGAYHSGYLAGKAEVEEAVRKERERIEEQVLTPLYEKIDKWFQEKHDIIGQGALAAVFEEALQAITPNHQD